MWVRIPPLPHFFFLFLFYFNFFLICRSVSPAGVAVEFQQVNAYLNFNQITDILDTKLSSPERQGKTVQKHNIITNQAP